MKGINATIFAYGQTGSGKTFTMYGKNQESAFLEKDASGVAQRAVMQIFQQSENESGSNGMYEDE